MGWSWCREGPPQCGCAGSAHWHCALAWRDGLWGVTGDLHALLSWLLLRSVVKKCGTQRLGNQCGARKRNRGARASPSARLPSQLPPCRLLLLRFLRLLLLLLGRRQAAVVDALALDAPQPPLVHLPLVPPDVEALKAPLLLGKGAVHSARALDCHIRPAAAGGEGSVVAGSNNTVANAGVAGGRGKTRRCVWRAPAQAAAPRPAPQHTPTPAHSSTIHTGSPAYSSSIVERLSSG